MTSGWLQRRRRRGTTLYGRDQELALLRELLDAADGDEGALVLISGEAGIGKTALVDALAAQAGQRGFTVLRGNCFDLTTTPPYGPWLEALRTYDPSVTDISAPEWFTTDQQEHVGSQVAVLEDAHHFFSVLAKQHPVLIVLEDLHWSDPASLDALRFLARRLLHQRVLIVGTFRDDEITRDHRLFELLPALVRESSAIRVHLPALDEDALSDLAAERYDVDDADLSRLTAHLARLSEGNPLYATELLNGLEDAGLMRKDGARDRLGKLTGASVPPLIQQVIERRMTGLAVEDRRLLEIAAVIGHEFSVDVWSDVSGETVDGIVTAVERADAVDVLQPDGRVDRVRFRHALIREVLFQSLIPVRRRDWHRRIAELLIATPHATPDEIAHHFEQAADYRAAEWLIRAGNRAERAYAWASAVERFSRALPLLDESPEQRRVQAWLRYRVGRLLRYMDRYAALEALEAAKDAARRVGEPRLEQLAGFHCCLVLHYCGEARRAQTEMAAVIAAAEAEPPAGGNGLPERRVDGNGPSRSSLLELVQTGTIGGTGPIVLGANGLWAPRATYLLGEAIRGNYLRVQEQAPQVVAEIVTHDPDAGEERRLPQEIGFARGIANAGLGRPDDALRYFDASREASEGISHYLLACTAAAQALHLAILPYHTDRVAERQRYTRIALEHGQRTMEAALSNQAPGGLARLGWEYLVSGRWDSLPIDPELARLSFMVEDDREDAAEALAHLAYFRGDRDRACAIVRDFMPDGFDSEPGDSSFAAGCGLIRLAAHMHMDAGDLDEARGWLTAHNRWLAWSGSILGRSQGTLCWARYYQMLSNIEQAWQTGQRALREASDPRQPLALIAVHRFLGQLAVQRGEIDEAWQNLRASIEIARACEAPYEQALTMLAMADLHARTGQHDAARRSLCRVRSICVPLGARPALERAGALEAAIPVERVVLTPREVDVLRLVARGMTDVQTADELFISPRTVGQHLRSIYAKLGVSNRTEAARIASDRKLI
jgi:DNA-binding NarL/FixJ family response regulator